MVAGFMEFIRKQGVVGLAVGFVLGGAVSKVVTALVTDIINPLLGILIGKTEGLKEAKLALSGVERLWEILEVLRLIFSSLRICYYTVKLLGIEMGKIEVILIF
jgi:large conductance mechanosensitive channel protein